MTYFELPAENDESYRPTRAGGQSCILRGQDAELIEIMLAGEWSWAVEPHEAGRPPAALAAFRRADLGATSLPV